MLAKRSLFVCAGILWLAGPVFWPCSATAAWPTDPLTNLRVCGNEYPQQAPVITSDGAEGAIIAWTDSRSDPITHIYAQRVLASGVVDPGWPIDGRVLCLAFGGSPPAGQSGQKIVSDGAGGAIVAWLDARSGTQGDIYAQHVLASGVVDPGWPVDGRALSVTPIYGYLRMIPDGAGGAVVEWSDRNSSTGYFDIHAQHVLGSGVVGWQTDGVAVSTGYVWEDPPDIVSDGLGGAIIAWVDTRNYRWDIYAQHVLAGGALDPAWPANGRALCTAPGGGGTGLRIASDGAGGAIVAWDDYRGSPDQIYAQHVQASGAVDPSWPVDGRALCATFASQRAPTIVSDGAGGALIAWVDYRNVGNDVYAQHVLATGVVDPAWPADGHNLGGAPYDQKGPTAERDGAGGALVTWWDDRTNSGRGHIYVQHVLPSGVDPAWPVNGLPVCIDPSGQDTPTIAGDGAGGAIITWRDGRGITAPDIFAQRVTQDGYLGNPETPRILGATDVPHDQGGKLRVNWKASSLDGKSQMDDYVLRRWQVDHWQPIALVAPTGAATYTRLVSTSADSMSGSVPWNLFTVDAQAGEVAYPSPPDSGYSVDNLAPAIPRSFTGQYSAGTSRLHWNPNAEADLAGYRLYRASNPDFVPDASNLIAALTDTAYVDASGPHFYKLAAIDVHDNLSDFAALLPNGIVGVGADDAPALTLDRVGPNPTRARSLSVRFTLTSASPAWLELLDVTGRRIFAREVGSLGAGSHALSLTDERHLTPGVYIIRLRQGPEGRLVRLVVL